MLLDRRNIWTFGRASWVVVWANAGFKEHKGYRHPFEAILSTNSSRQAVALDRTDSLRYAWARHCCAHSNGTPHMRYPLQDAKVAGVLVVPTKPMDVGAPWRSWTNLSPALYFEQQVADLCWFVRRVYKEQTILHVPRDRGEVCAEVAHGVFERHAKGDLFVLGQ